MKTKEMMKIKKKIAQDMKDPTPKIAPMDLTDPGFPTKSQLIPEHAHLFKNWWIFDNQNVEKVNVKMLSQLFGGKNHQSAVVLYYQRSELQPGKAFSWPTDAVPPELAEIQKEDISNRKALFSIESLKQRLCLRIRHVDEAYNFDSGNISPGFQHVIQLHFNHSLRDLQDKVKADLSLPSDSRFFLIRYDKLPNGSMKFSHIIPDVNCWTRDFLLVKNMQIFHNNDYLLVPVEHPKFDHFASKVTLANVCVRLKLNAAGGRIDLWVPKYSTAKQLIKTLSPFAAWHIELDDIYLLVDGKLTPMAAVKSLCHVADDTEVMLRRA